MSISLLIIIFARPLMCMIAIVIVPESGHPIIFQQERQGRNGKVFKIYTQEFWAIENWACLEAGAAVVAGALFDYVAGIVRRGPRWMTDHGLEWLARLAIEPMRLCGRYVARLPVFFARGGMEAARHRRAAA